MTNSAPAEAKHTWLRWFVTGTLIVVILWWCVVAWLVAPPPGHALLCAPFPKGDAWDIVQFEVSYFTFLASITGAVVAAMLAFLEFEKGNGGWRRPTILAVSSLMVAIAFVVIGYAMRNIWIVSQSPLNSRLVAIDAFANGPITALAYMLGLGAMLRALWARFSP